MKPFFSKSSREWIQILEGAGIPCGLIYSLQEVFRDPQVLHREMFQEVEHPNLGKIKVVGSPIKMSRTPALIHSHPPTLGEHTNEILSRLGYNKEEIETLRKQEII